MPWGRISPPEAHKLSAYCLVARQLRVSAERPGKTGFFARCISCRMLFRNTSRGRTAMGWEEVWRLAMKHFVAEPIELRILIGLGVAFLGLMMLVGLKHAFRSAEPASQTHEPEPPLILSTLAPAPVAVASIVPAAAPAVSKPAAQLFRVRKFAPRKSVKQTIKPYAPPRPKIRRVAGPARKPRFAEHRGSDAPLTPRS